MFNNRTFEVRMKGKKDDTVDDRPTPTLQDYTAHATSFMEVGGRKIVKMVAAYIAMDTARKVVVNRLSK